VVAAAGERAEGPGQREVVARHARFHFQVADGAPVSVSVPVPEQSIGPAVWWTEVTVS